VLHTTLSPSLGYLTNAPPEGVGASLVKEYKDILIKVGEWGAFEASDIKRNDLDIFFHGTVPDFVAKFERELDRKPGLAPDVCCLLDHTFDADRSM
jgi:hypothetical protein